MKLTELNLGTDLEIVKKKRSSTINMARVIFDRRQPNAIYAFSQFKDHKDLWNLILAKKKGVYDFGKDIVRDGVLGWTHPHPFEANKKFVDELQKLFGTIDKDKLLSKMADMPDINMEIKMSDFNIDTEKKWLKMSEMETTSLVFLFAAIEPRARCRSRRRG